MSTPSAATSTISSPLCHQTGQADDTPGEQQGPQAGPPAHRQIETAQVREADASPQSAAMHELSPDQNGEDQPSEQPQGVGEAQGVHPRQTSACWAVVGVAV